MTKQRGQNQPGKNELMNPEAFGALISAVSQAHSEFIYSAEVVASENDLTPARWQVIQAAALKPATVSDIARALGLTRQSVQRVADDAVKLGLATYRSNPKHSRASLLAPTKKGRAAVEATQAAQAKWVAAVASRISAEQADHVLTAIGLILDASQRHWDEADGDEADG